MTSKKKRLGNNLSSLLEMAPLPVSLEKLVGATSLPDQPPSASPINLSTGLSLENIAADLGAPKADESMDLFIDKYSTPTYSSLDELLEASIQTNQFVHTYMAPGKKDSDSLFSGLGDLLDM